MATRLNKKVLCFIDEYGTAGAGDLYLGALIVLAREAGRLDKCFSDQLEANVNEIHAVQLDDGYLQGLMARFWQAAPTACLVLINRKLGMVGPPAPVLYAQAMIETVKVGLKRFRHDVLGRSNINNVEVITDINHHNSHTEFDAEIANAQAQGGVFRSVNHVARINSAASRLLQLADVVAHSRKWIVSDELNAAGLRDRYGIQVL